MKNSLSTVLALLLATALVAAQDTKPASTPNETSASRNAQTARATTRDEIPILKGAELKTEWASARNPFRFEAIDTPAYAPERVEQMQVLGFSKMPDEHGFLQTYAFITKTTEGAHVQGSKLETKIPKNVYVLRALPEKLDEQTVTTEEQIEESSIALGSEHLWFLGIVQTNSQTIANFVPDNATYPIMEEDLRPFEVRDSLKDLHIRITKAGKRISTEVESPRLYSRPRTPATPDMAQPATAGKSPSVPAAQIPKEKPTADMNPVKERDDALKGIGQDSGGPVSKP